MFLVFGGKKDYNIRAFIKSLELHNIKFLPILLEEGEIPNIVWDMERSMLIVNNKIVSCSAIFLRNDVFNSVTSSATSYTWFKTIRSWALADKNISLFNKQYIGMNKSYNLALAKEVGLATPHTIITNQISLLRKITHPKQYIIKPIIGGKYTLTLADYLANENNYKENHTPLMYLQNRLIQPEMRIYGIGKQFFAFNIISNQLDYRVDSKTKIIETVVPVHLSAKLLGLMEALKLDFGAADFKTCPKTGEYLFLEINSGPMFSKFDSISKGKLSKAMIDWHLKNEG